MYLVLIIVILMTDKGSFLKVRAELFKCSQNVHFRSSDFLGNRVTAVVDVFGIFYRSEATSVLDFRIVSYHRMCLIFSQFSEIARKILTSLYISLPPSLMSWRVSKAKDIRLNSTSLITF